MHQLLYSGALEVVRIRRELYPIKISFRDFFDKYSNPLLAVAQVTPGFFFGANGSCCSRHTSNPRLFSPAPSA